MCLTAKDLTEDEKRGLSKNVKGVITKGQIDKTALLALTNKLLSVRSQTVAELIKPPGTQVAWKMKKKAERKGPAILQKMGGKQLTLPEDLLRKVEEWLS